MAARTIHSESIKQAIEKFPVLKQTKNLADKMQVKLLQHYYKLTKRGAVSQHQFLVRFEWTENGEAKSRNEVYSNQVLLGLLKNMKQRTEPNF